MHTEHEKLPAKPTGKKYCSVDDFLSGDGTSHEVRSKLHELRNETRVVFQLAKLRQSQGITQEAMANELNVTQSTISKLESGRDEDLTLREVREYARVTGQRISVMLGKPLTHVEAVKLHAYGLKARLEALAQIANQHDELEKEIKGFFGEAFFNFLNIIAVCSDKLPNGEHDVQIKIEILKGDQTSFSAPPLATQKSELYA